MRNDDSVYQGDEDEYDESTEYDLDDYVQDIFDTFMGNENMDLLPDDYEDFWD
ncbi:MAG: hypothetical protein PHP23_10385 [Desulfobacterales bacterium]|nr:hypothetical protein [Desulfobacterales bacterium]MDD4072068.1 hypothetical protein [Desulfobacterales bacterium]MDD4391334.1 hypothetical protein [Desulfobacterales bacterium]